MLYFGRERNKYRNKLFKGHGNVTFWGKTSLIKDVKSYTRGNNKCNVNSEALVPYLVSHFLKNFCIKCLFLLACEK